MLGTPRNFDRFRLRLAVNQKSYRFVNSGSMFMLYYELIKGCIMGHVSNTD